jgi:pyruvate/2-oxoglutarate dehydrogenase complex dihydrolipoamide acyltransferase (E2) component
MHYLMTVDVTAARRLMAMAPETLSLTGFVTVSVARAVAAHPVVHAYRDWRGRLVTHRYVDVMVPIEARTERGPRVVPHVVADADLRDVAEVSTELLSTEDSPSTGAEQLFGDLPGLTRIPGLIRAVYAVRDRSVRLRRRSGTVAVTTTGMRDIGETFGVPEPALMPLQVVIGSLSACPHQTGNLIERHEILNLTLSFDHDLVGGAEAAEFATGLCSTIERAEVLQAYTTGTVSQPAAPIGEALTVPPSADSIL